MHIVHSTSWWYIVKHICIFEGIDTSMNVVLWCLYTDLVTRRQTYMYIWLYMYILVWSPYLYVNTCNSVYWYIWVRSVSVYSTQGAFEMSLRNHQNTCEYGVNVFFVVFFFDTYYYIRITYKYVKKYLYDTCQ